MKVSPLLGQWFVAYGASQTASECEQSFLEPRPMLDELLGGRRMRRGSATIQNQEGLHTSVLLPFSTRNLKQAKRTLLVRGASSQAFNFLCFRVAPMTHLPLERGARRKVARPEHVWAIGVRKQV